MSISSRITSMEEHVTNAYNGLQGLGADLTGIDKNIDNIASVLDDIYDDLPKVTGSGTSITLDDTRKGRVNMEFSGNTSQFTTTGKNLLPNNGTTLTRNGMTFTVNVDGSYTLNGTTTAATDYNICQSGELQLAAGTYTLSSTTNIPSGMWLSVYEGSSDRWAMTGANTKEMVLSAASTNARAHFYINSGVTLTNLRIYPMIVSGTTVGNYEPYTGKAASPSPDYPQEVHIVRGDNTIKIEGKNIIDLTSLLYRTSSTSTSDREANSFTQYGMGNWGNTAFYIKNNKKNTNYTISMKALSSLARRSGVSVYGGADTDVTTPYTNIGTQWLDIDANTQGSTSYSFNSGDYEYLMVRFWNNGTATALSSNVALYISDVQLEYGSSFTGYEPYNVTSYPINLGVKNLWNSEDMKSGYLPQSGSYPTTNSSYPNARYVLVNLIKGQSITLSGVTFSGSGRVRYIDIDTNQVVGNMTYLDSAYYTATHIFGDGFYEGTITAKKDFIVGIMDLNNDVSGLIVNYGTTPQTISPNPIELGIISTYKDKLFRTSGKNLFDKSTVTTSAYLKEDGTLQTGTGAEYITSDFIPVTPNTTYYKTLTLSPRTKFYDENKQVLDNSTYQDVSVGGNAGSFTTPNNAYYFRFTGNVNASTGININTTMVNKGDTAIDYEPYGSGEWYLHKEIGKGVFDGNGDYGLDGTNANRTAIYSPEISNIENYTDGSDMPNMISNYFTPITLSETWVPGRISRRLNTPRISFLIDPNMTLDDFKTWLSTHNTKVYYVLATPTTTEITYQPLIDQLNLLEKAQSKENQTNISQVNNDLPFIISASALKEWQESTSLNSTLSMVNPLSLGNTLNTQENDIQPIEVDNIEPLEEEENEES